MMVIVLIIFCSFFLPWITVDSPIAGGFTKLLTGKRQAQISSISGFQVPILANSSESRFMISVIKIFNPTIKDADKKSFLIWGVPLFAVVLFFLWSFLGRNKWVNLGIAIVGITIFSFASFKIATTNLDKLVLKVNIAYGLWLILTGYLLIGLLCLVDFWELCRNERKK
ncbi:MAG TPA: hypothetical protein PKH98_02705 [Candidatus Omnitrophota bacterium]|nr:hypothetical protein [Candidatus Omnitrophota bacterium]